MLDFVQSQSINLNYYDRKYAAYSLVYRSTKGVAAIGENLAEYLTQAAKEEGIGDMIGISDDGAQRAEILNSGADLLKEIVAFHIDAASRRRYAKAAYYMCVLRDIFVYLNDENSFQHYFKETLADNSRRRALLDEMRIVYGKAATKLK